MARKRRESPKLGRRAPTRELGAVHWVFCEGATEKRCLDALRSHWRLPAVHITVVGQVGSPWTIVEKACAKLRELRRVHGAGAEVHVVFDRDEHPRFREAIARAQQLGLGLGVSVPCVELWGLLLHCDQTAALDRHEAQRRLAQLHPGYHHESHPYFELGAVLSGLDDARARAAHLARRAEDVGDPFANPSTTFGEVIAALAPRR